MSVWLAAVPAIAWLYLLAAHGRFWRVTRALPPATAAAHPARRVVAVVPARNEADVIGAAVRSLLQQSFNGALEIVLVDDDSDDGTAEVARLAADALGAASKLTVLRASSPPDGWTGKLWALAQGVELARASAPDYLLFTDADIQHAPDSIGSLVAIAESQRRDLVSYMVRLSVASVAEKFAIPAFVFFFFMLYPPTWTASQRHRTAGAAGGCLLIRPQMLQRIGGLQRLRSEIIDDCALARAAKRAGGRVWLGLTRSARSLRSYPSLAAIGRMIARTAFYQLHHSYLLLAVTLAGLWLAYGLAPWLALHGGDPRSTALGAGAWVLMSLAYLPMVRFYRLSPLWSLCLPAIAAFYGGATVYSALQYRLGRGGQWKGRAQDRRVARAPPAPRGAAPLRAVRIEPGGGRPRLEGSTIDGDGGKP